DYGDYEEPQKNCSLKVSITGGSVSYSNEGLEGRQDTTLFQQHKESVTEMGN
ncbi:hypothetical protein M9458_029411, partial [Cirrhinus mrigala]